MAMSKAERIYMPTGRFSQMSRVYEMDAFEYRVQFAANVISRNGAQTRAFDTTCEMYDGDAVIAALVRRIAKHPNSKLAKNFFRYFSPCAIQGDIYAYSLMPFQKIVEWAAQLRHATQLRRKEETPMGDRSAQLD